MGKINSPAFAYMNDVTNALKPSDDLAAVITRFMNLEAMASQENAMALDLFNAILILAREIAELKGRVG
jgi:hypothetical protein